MARDKTIRVAIPSLPPMAFVLRPVNGRVESALSPQRAGEPTRLLAALLRTVDGGTVDMAALPVSVHDRLLAEVYRNEIDDKANCRANCSHCAEPFEFELSVGELIAAQDVAAAEVGPLAEDGRWAFSDKRLRPPTLADAGLGEQSALFAALCTPAPLDEELPEIAAFLESVAPLFAITLDTKCPHCEAAQKFDFDLPRFLIAALAQERPFLVREVHLLASRYGWGHAEIMDLPKDDRRAFATLIESERGAALRQRQRVLG